MSRALAVWIFCVSACALTHVYAENPRIKAEEQAAERDRAQFAASEHWRFWYITTTYGAPKFQKGNIIIEEQARQATALKLIIASTTRQTIVEKCIPVQVTSTLYRIDLADLKWDYKTWLEYLNTYPYASVSKPLVTRADWHVVQLGDATEQQQPIYYALLFGKQPVNRDEALKILGIDQSFDKQFGWIEGKSKVSKVGKRWIANFATPRGYTWGTKDVLELTRESDMLEHPDGSFKHDGEEWIFGLFKKHNTTGTTGVLQGYLLADGAGKLVAKAPIDLVEDTTRFRNYAEIRSPGSCVQCHAALNDGSQDELRGLLESGVYAATDYANKEKIESFNFSDISGKEIRRGNEDYAAIVKLICGCTPREAQFAFSATVKAYDRDLTLARACWELGVSADAFKHALGLESSASAKLPARMAGLAHNISCPRVAFEPAYKDLNYGILPSHVNSN